MKNKLKILLSTICVVGMVACSSSASDKERLSGIVEDIEHCDTLPAGIRHLVRAVADGDSLRFARMIAYPLSRPYPLHDIDNDKQMLAYYPTLMDDSLRNVITGSGPALWGQFGWRGWALRDGQYLWLDNDSIYSIAYVSAREKQMMDSLTRIDVASLEPSLRLVNWKPVGCYMADKTGAVYRIDLNPQAGEDAAYRLTVFTSVKNMRSFPTMIYTGYLELDGSAMFGTYHLMGADGTACTFCMDPTDGSQLAFELQPEDSETVEVIPVHPVYWLDILPK